MCSMGAGSLAAVLSFPPRMDSTEARSTVETALALVLDSIVVPSIKDLKNCE